MIPERVQQVLDTHGLRVLEFEEGSTPTAATAAEKIGVEVGQIAKSILMKGKDDRYRLFVVAGNRKISSGAVKRLTGVKHRMSTAGETAEVTGYKPGGVCPFALPPEVEVYVDDSLADYETIYPAAGNDATGVPVSYSRLREITGAFECSVGNPASVSV